MKNKNWERWSQTILFGYFLFFVKLATGVTFHLKPNIKNSNYNNYTPERMRHQRKTFAPGSDGKLQTNCSHSSAEDALITARTCRQLQQKKHWKKKFPRIPFRLLPTAQNKCLSHSEMSKDLLAQGSCWIHFFNVTTSDSWLSCGGNGYLGWEPPLNTTGRQTKPQRMRARPAQTQTIMNNSLELHSLKCWERFNTVDALIQIWNERAFNISP